MATYYEQLKHPKWQEKRLAILSRAKFTCEKCKATDKTLHVHHAYYEKGLAPWEYSDLSLHCLCEDCHRDEQDYLAQLYALIGLLPLADMEELLGLVSGLLLRHCTNEYEIKVSSSLIAEGVARAWSGLAEETAARILQHGRINKLHVALFTAQTERRPSTRSAAPCG